MMVLPLLPALDGTIDQNPTSLTQPLTQVMYWQYRTLRNLRHAIVEAGANFDEFVSVFGLRTHGQLDSGVVTEEVYVHSKVMLVDDERAIVGSANLNDRSLLGMRDSEVCVVLRDTSTVPSELGGDAWQAGRFAHGLRTALWAQHLRWNREEVEKTFADPLSETTLREIRKVARENTQIYEELFGVLPSDKVRTWEELAARREGAGQLGDITRTTSAARAEEELSRVQGHLVEFPLDFLVEEDLAPSAISTALNPVSWQPDAFN